MLLKYIMGKKPTLFCLKTLGDLYCNKTNKVKQCDTLQFRSNSLQITSGKSCGTVCVNIESFNTTSIAQFYGLGAQVVLPGQPFLVPSTQITSQHITPLPLGTGTIFNLKRSGKYQVSYNTIYPDDASVLLYAGPNSSSLQPLTPYTLSSNMSGTFNVQVPSANYYLGLYASSDNTSNINVPATSSTNNQSVTSLSITYLGC